MKRLPKGHRYVKQSGYKRGNFYNWCIYDAAGKLLTIAGKTKKDARERALQEIN